MLTLIYYIAAGRFAWRLWQQVLFGIPIAGIIYFAFVDHGAIGGLSVTAWAAAGVTIGWLSRSRWPLGGVKDKWP